MNMEQLKQYIMSILIEHNDMLAISPDLIIDRLFDKLNILQVIDINGFREHAGSDTNQIIWDRHLMPILAQADFYVKVFARSA